MIDQIPVVTVVLLCLIALLAGWVDAVVGGGGIIQLPSLLIGLPGSTPIATVSGTNKLSSIAGTTVAAGTYVRKVKIHWPTALALIGTAFAGSALGARLVQLADRTFYMPVLVVVVAGIGVYTWRRPYLGQKTSLKHKGAIHWLLAATIGVAVGVWDGLVGPGTGVFFVIGLVAILGYGFLESTTMAKLANFATNVAALIVLGTSGHVLWLLGGCMAACNLVGGAVGSAMAIRYGNRFVRMVFLVAVVFVEIKLIWDTAMLLV